MTRPTSTRQTTRTADHALTMEEAMEAPLVPFVGDPTDAPGTDPADATDATGATDPADATDATGATDATDAADPADGGTADLRRRMVALQAQLDRIEARIEGRR